MFEATGNELRVTRGDTGLLTISTSGTELTDADRAVMTARKKGGGVLFRKTAVPEDNCVQFAFGNAETEKWKPGSYEWDVRFALGAVIVGGEVTNGREIVTPAGMPGRLTVLDAVGVI